MLRLYKHQTRVLVLQELWVSLNPAPSLSHFSHAFCHVRTAVESTLGQAPHFFIFRKAPRMLLAALRQWTVYTEE